MKLLLPLLLTLILSVAHTAPTSSATTSQAFCDTYKCVCPNASREIKCRFNETVITVDFEDRGVTTIDFSHNSLESFWFGDNTALNVQYLYINDNHLRVINLDFFKRLPHLKRLDLSQNKIDSLDETAFEPLNVLEFLNMSQAYAANYRINRDLCELVNLKTLDLSYSDLDQFELACWRETKNERLISLHLRHTTHVEKSISNWLPYVGSNLKSLDLSDSDVRFIDAPYWSTNMASLVELKLNNLPTLDLQSLYKLLGPSRFIERLETLHMANVSANSKTLDMSSLLATSNMTRLPLLSLDIARNGYDGDLNVFLFNQHKLRSLKEFRASQNNFSVCNAKLDAPQFLASLQVLDLSANQLTQSSCLYPLKTLDTLTHLDLSYNSLSLTPIDFIENEFVHFFASKPALAHIDFSHNLFTFFLVYFKPNHTNIQKINFASNRLTAFRFLSLSRVNSPTFFADLRDEKVMKSQVEQDVLDANTYDTFDNTGDLVIDSPQHADEYDDDQRFVYINQIDLSANSFKFLDLQHMLQSIRNIVDIKLSENPLEKVIGMSNDSPITTTVILNSNGTDAEDSAEESGEKSSKSVVAGNGSGGKSPKSVVVGNGIIAGNGGAVVDLSPVKEVLCIDQLDLSDCQLASVPNMQHTCINKIDLSRNRIAGSVHLVISRFSIYFLDYLDLQANNITKVSLVVSDAKYKQDFYPSQNAPYHYFYGSEEATKQGKNASAHTFLDLMGNENFVCDCSLVAELSEFMFVKVLSPCYTREFATDCMKTTQSNTVYRLRSLSKNVRILLIVTCFVLVVLSLFTLNYLCADVMKKQKMRPCTWFKVRATQCVNRFGAPGAGSGANADKNIGVQYSKLDNQASVSQIEINA